MYELMEVKERYLYILKLSNNKFYIGQSNVPDARIQKHFKGKGSAWTKMYNPLKVIEKKSLGVLNYKEAEILENNYVLDYMRKYGWSNVRGGYFTACDDDYLYKNLISHQKRKTFEIDFL